MKQTLKSALSIFIAMMLSIVITLTIITVALYAAKTIIEWMS